MEQSMMLADGKSRKRKAMEEPDMSTVFSLDELNQDLLERVLSRLPASSFVRLQSVCKRWRSVTTSATFQMACSQIATREPWFLMVDQDLDHSVVFDTSEGNWKNLNPKIDLQQGRSCNAMPVATSGGLACYRTDSGDLIVCNPVTGACRELPHVVPAGQASNLHAIAMYSSSCDSSLYKVVLVSGELSNLSFRVFDSAKLAWEEEVMLVQKAENFVDSHMVGDDIVYYLSKAGDVVATNMQRSPSKQYSSVMMCENGEEVVYFLSHSGTIVACNLARRTSFEYPRLLPVHMEYSIDVVKCNGEMVVAVLSEFLESMSLRLWKFSKEDWSWQQVAMMPPAMSHDYYGKKLDINCSSSRDSIFICVNSCEFSSCVMFNVVSNEWVELPKCTVNGTAKEFMSAFSFEPRVEVAA